MDSNITGHALLHLIFFIRTVPVAGLHGVRCSCPSHEYGLDLRDTHPLTLRAALQHLARKTPLALFYCRTHHACHF